MSVLDAVLETGINIHHSHKAGHCGRCAVKVLNGDVLHLDSVLTKAQTIEQKPMCLCVSRENSKHLILDI